MGIEVGLLLGAAAGVYGANKSAGAARDATKAQVDASNQAIAAQNEAQKMAIDEQRRQFDTTRQDTINMLAQQRIDQTPWRDAGLNALTRLAMEAGNVPASAYGQFNPNDLAAYGAVQGANARVPGEYGNFSMADYQADPGYQFRLAEGEKAIKRGAAASGMLNSGATLKALQRFNSNLASEEFGNAFSRFRNQQDAQFNRENINQSNAFDRQRANIQDAYARFSGDQMNRFNRDTTTQTNRFNQLASLAGVGQSAANNIGNAAANANSTIANTGANATGAIGGYLMSGAQNNGNLLTGIGNARAAGSIGSANAWNNAIGQGLNLYNSYNMLNALRSPNGYGAAPSWGSITSGWNSGTGY